MSPALVIDRLVYRDHERHRALADQLMAANGLTANDVLEMRLTEGHIEIDHLERHDVLGFVLDTNGTLVVRTLVLAGESPTRGAYVDATATQTADRSRNTPMSAERTTDTGNETT